MNIDGELEDLGVKDVKTNYAKGQTEVEYDDEKIPVQKIQETIKALGYTTSIKN
jgi:copper chaperone CopZ